MLGRARWELLTFIRSVVRASRLQSMGASLVDNRLMWDCPRNSCNQHPHLGNQCASNQGTARTADVPQSVRLDV